jgi:hypothetical protein
VKTNAGQLISGDASKIKFKSIEISTSYLNLSMLSFPPKPAGAAAYLPKERRLIRPPLVFSYSRSAGLFTPLPPRFNTSV